MGSANLSRILNLGYSTLETWSNRLLKDCRMLDNVIAALGRNCAITTVNGGNTRYLLAAGSKP